jgi:hypothetical protein
MLALLKKLIGKQDSADLVSTEAIDIIKRHQRFNEEQRREMMSAFEHAKARLEIENGEIQTWALQCKALVAKQTLQMAKDAYQFAPYGSCGEHLLASTWKRRACPATRQSGSSTKSTNGTGEQPH